MHLASFIYPPVGNHGAWRMKESRPEMDLDINAHVEAARLAEAAKMDTIFYADTMAIKRSNNLHRGDTYGGVQPDAMALEPPTLLAALAMVTKHIGLAATASTTYNEPFNIARRFATLDHISHGRAGWNLVTSQNDNEAANFRAGDHMDHADRYERAAEFFEVVSKLWDTWDAGAVTRDKESGVYFDISKMHFADHHGKHFDVRGPLNIDTPPQGYPVIFQAGSSGVGKELAARTADVVFTAQNDIAAALAFRKDLNQLLAKYGRKPGDLKVLVGFGPTVGDTEQSAHALAQRMQDLIPDDQAISALLHISGGLDLRQFPLDGPLPDLPPANTAKGRQDLVVALAKRDNLTLRQVAKRWADGQGHLMKVGTPEQVADMMEEWVNAGACDGFVVKYSHFPGGVYDFMQGVIPELQRRGSFRTEYEGKTLRDHLGLQRRGRNA